MKLGQKIGGYEIIDILTSSKEGVTYKVRNTVVDRMEALRVMPKALQDDQEKSTRFLREAKIHAQMNHPNIVSFYHAVHLEGQLVITTELVEGTTLAQRESLGLLPLADALGYAGQVLSALGHAHSLGIVHRDVTPENIILTTSGAAKLSGFSLAKATTDPQLTQPGTVMGTLHYISPEQVMGKTSLDGRTDIYALGVVLYEAVTGRKPFQEKSQFEVMAAHVNALPPAPSVVNPALPAELSEIILKAMAKDPAARFQSAEEFLGRLGRMGSQQPHAPSEPYRAGPPPLPALPPQQPPPGYPQVAQGALASQRPMAQNNFWMLAAAALATFLIVMLAFFAIVRRF